MNRDREILFEVGDDALLVANGGRAFSREGVISICASHLSDKRSDDANDDVRDNFGGADKDLVQKIRERELATYCTDPNRITSDYRGEDETSRDYDGRIVWELLQNADDAMGRERSSAELIGSKGLGFKAVLDVTEEPEVHSGPFHFRFSSADTQAILKKEGLHNQPPPLTFRIPHCTAPCERVQELLEAGYATVIRLPFRDNEARDSVVKQLHDFNPLFLLLAPRLTRVRIRTSNGDTVHEITGNSDGLADGDVQLSRKGPNGWESVPWRRWTWRGSQEAKNLTVAVCLPLGDRQSALEPVHYPQCLPLFVFFPTHEEPRAHALIHATFDLEQNRKHVRPGDQDDKMLRALGALVGRVLDDVPARTALNAFGTVKSHDDSLIGQLQQVVRDKLAASPFIPTVGGRTVRAADVCLWKYRFGDVLNVEIAEVIAAGLLAPGHRELIPILRRRFGAEYLSSSRYFYLLRHCRNASFEECLRSWITLMRLVKKHGWTEAASEIPCWWTQTETARGLAESTPLLLRRPKDWPNWLAAEALHPRMAKAVKRRGLTAISPELLRNARAYLGHALVPHVSRWNADEWEEDGWRALSQARQWWSGKKFDDIDPWVETHHHRNSWRECVANRFRIPTDKGWHPATDCYAGHAWGGFAAFDRFFADVRSRGIVRPLDQWPQSIRDRIAEEDWKPFLRWLGVSWEPKVRAMRDCAPIDEQSQYLRYLGLFSRARWKFNLRIEFFPECVDNSGERVRDDLVASIRLADALSRSTAYYRGEQYGYKSYAWYQICHSAWLPCKPTLLHASQWVVPSQAFMPGKGLRGLLPEVQRTGIDDEFWFNDCRPVLLGLGVRDSLPEDAKEWHSWMHQMSRVEYEPDEGKSVLAAAEALYRGYLRLDGPAQHFPSSIRIPCLGLVDDRETLGFADADDVYYVDEPHLDAIKRDVMRRKYKLFILSLKSGEDAVDRLGVARLSKALRPIPRYDHEDTRANEQMRRRYKRCRLGLELAAGLEGKLPEELDIASCRGLRLDLVGKKAVVAEADVLSWREAGVESPLLVNLDKNRWRALGHGIAIWIAKEEGRASLFEALLRERNNGEYLDRLRHEGITEADLVRAENELGDGTGDPADSEPAPSEPAEADGRGEARAQGAPELPRRNSHVSHHSYGSSARSNEEPTGTGSRSRQGSRPSGSGRSRPERKTAGSGRPDAGKGRAAEDWLEKKLALSSSGRYRIKRPERDSKNRESDFVVRGDTDLHIEVKHLSGVPGKVYWSSGQCSKACDMVDGEGEEYVMALLVSDREERYRVYWIWRPVDQLVGARREVQWEGRTGYERVRADGWNVEAEQPDQVPVKRHIFRIHVDHELLGSLVEDDESLKELWSRVDQWST